jgi:hypothetical protein
LLSISKSSSSAAIEERNAQLKGAITTYMMMRFALLALFALWPFSSGKNFQMTSNPSVPAASGTVHAQWDKNNRDTKLDIKVDNLAQPSNLSPPANTYVVWVRPNDGHAMREGALGVNKNLDGELHVVTVSKDFEVFITPEQSRTVTTPSSMEVLRAHVSID